MNDVNPRGEGWFSRVRLAGASLFQRFNRGLGGVPGIFIDAVRHFNTSWGAQAAASMAYYFLFALFPLLLSVIAIGSLFLQSDQVQLEVMRVISLTIPISRQLISDNIQEILKNRGTIGVIAVIGLLWSASGALSTLFRYTNRAWVTAAPLNAFKSQLTAIIFILILGVALVFLLIVNSLVGFIPSVTASLGLPAGFFGSTLWTVLSQAISLVVTFVFFFWLYWWVPNTHVRRKEAFWPALTAAVGCYLTTLLFSFYLSSGLVNYEMVYGTLGTTIILLFWIYINSLIILFCAYFSASIAEHTRAKL